MSLTYKYKVGQPKPTAMVIDVSLENGHTSGLGKLALPSLYELIRLGENTMYRDLAVAWKRLYVMKTQWAKMKIHTIYVHFNNDILGMAKNKIEHIVCKILSVFLPDSNLSNILVIVTHSAGVSRTALATIKESIQMSKKILGARMMAMLPANVATPAFMEHIFRGLFEKCDHVRIETMDTQRLKKDGYELIHSVGIGSENKPCMMIVERLGSGGGKKPCVAIVGKGITFDSGGLAIKNLSNMIDMKYDKIGAIYACAALLHLLEDPQWDHVTFMGVFPLAENAISDRAFRPGDVYTSFIGKTVEIANPDAEGRLILADAFGYLHKVKHKPSLIVDIATLTGHADSISCWHSGYYYSFPESLKDYVETMSDDIGERMIPMPTWKDYSDVLRSTVADLSNSPNDCGDAAVAAMFLKEFLPKSTKAWLHIDLAHETDGGIPRGHGIRTIIGTVEHYLGKTKK